MSRRNRDEYDRGRFEDDRITALEHAANQSEPPYVISIECSEHPGEVTDHIARATRIAEGKWSVSAVHPSANRGWRRRRDGQVEIVPKIFEMLVDDRPYSGSDVESEIAFIRDARRRFLFPCAICDRKAAIREESLVRKLDQAVRDAQHAVELSFLSGTRS